MNILRYLYLFVISCIALSACEHKDLCYDHSHITNVQVAFDWTLAPDAAPQTMSLYIFSEDGTKPQRYELLGHNGGKIKLTPGTYHAICLNSDTRNIDCRDKEHISSFLITTKDEDASQIATSLGTKGSTLPQTEGTEGERMVREPEMLWSGSLFNIEIKRDSENHITLLPSETSIKVSLTIQNVKNLKYVNAMKASLSGLAEGILPATGTQNDVCVTMPFSLYSTNNDSTLVAEIRTFGDCLSGDKNHYLNLYLVLKDGSQWNYTYDVTSQMHTDRTLKHIHIVLDELPIPEPEGGGEGEGGSGFVPSIGEWNSVNIGIKM